MTDKTIITLNNIGIDTHTTMPRARDMFMNAWAFDGRNTWRVGRNSNMKHIWKPVWKLPKQIRTAALLLGIKVPG